MVCSIVGVFSHVREVVCVSRRNHWQRFIAVDKGIHGIFIHVAAVIARIEGGFGLFGPYVEGKVEGKALGI
jgi:hypothetical protein